MRRWALLSLAVSLPAWAQEDAGTKPSIDVTQLPFSQDTVKLVMEQVAQPRIQECYEEMLSGMKKPVEGKILTSFVVNPEGVVKNAKVEKRGTTLRDKKFHQCVTEVLLALNFPKPPHGKDQPIEFPFNLKAIR